MPKRSPPSALRRWLVGPGGKRRILGQRVGGGLPRMLIRPLKEQHGHRNTQPLGDRGLRHHQRLCQAWPAGGAACGGEPGECHAGRELPAASARDHLLLHHPRCYVEDVGRARGLWRSSSASFVLAGGFSSFWPGRCAGTRACARVTFVWKPGPVDRRRNLHTTLNGRQATFWGARGHWPWWAVLPGSSSSGAEIVLRSCNSMG